MAQTASSLNHFNEQPRSTAYRAPAVGVDDNANIVQFHNIMRRYGWQEQYIEREVRDAYGQFNGWSVELYVNGLPAASAWATRKAHAKDIACYQWLVANGFRMARP